VRTGMPLGGPGKVCREPRRVLVDRVGLGGLFGRSGAGKQHIEKGVQAMVERHTHKSDHTVQVPDTLCPPLH